MHRRHLNLLGRPAGPAWLSLQQLDRMPTDEGVAPDFLSLEPAAGNQLMNPSSADRQSSGCFSDGHPLSKNLHHNEG
jgi:hypothetical protein